MRPSHFLRHALRVDHIETTPVLTLLGPADALLDALVLALRARHGRLRGFPVPDEPWDHELRRAQHVAALAVALQGAIAEYQSEQLERIDLDTNGY